MPLPQLAPSLPPSLPPFLASPVHLPHLHGKVSSRQSQEQRDENGPLIQHHQQHHQISHQHVQAKQKRLHQNRKRLLSYPSLLRRSSSSSCLAGATAAHPETEVTETFDGKGEEESTDDGSGILACGVDDGALEEVEDAGAALEEGGGGGREGEMEGRKEAG